MKLYHGSLNPTALRKAKIVYNFGLSECNKVKFFEQCMMLPLIRIFSMRQL